MNYSKTLQKYLNNQKSLKKTVLEKLFKIKAMDPKTLYEQTQAIRDHNYKIFFGRTNIVRNCTNTVSLWFAKHDQAGQQ